VNEVENRRRLRLLAACAISSALLLSSCEGSPGGEPSKSRPTVRLGSVNLSPCGEEQLAAGPQDAPVASGDGSASASPATSESGTAGEPGAGTASPEPHRFCGAVPGGPQGGRLSLTLLSSDARPTLDRRELLIWHPGGPGISPAQILLGEQSPADLDRFVVVAWDGVSASTTDGACGPQSSSFGVDRPPRTLAGLAAAAGRECAAKTVARAEQPSGVAGAATAGAAELERVREALGARQVTLLTHSYGTAIAERYIRLHPARVRAAVLDAPMTLGESWAARVAVTGRISDDVVALMLASCRPPDCPDAVRGIAAKGYDDLRRVVLAARPVSGASGLVLTPTQLDQATLLAARDASSWPAFLAAIGSSLAGDATDVALLAEQSYFGLDRATYYDVLCSDLRVPDSVAGILAAARGQGPLAQAIAEDLAPCSATPRHPTSGSAAVTALPAARVLVLASRYDVLAPVALVDGDRSMRAWTMCRTGVPGHTSYRDPAVHRLVQAFLATADASPAVRSPICAVR
jgi:pimeloyl-ACP methyl ester carboxylesterase